jgi:hypothetical protein
MNDMKAFPLSNMTGLNQQGMDLRDYFAAKAMQGLLSNPKLHEEILKIGQSWIYDSAYAMADKMMEVRNNEPS